MSESRTKPPRRTGTADLSEIRGNTKLRFSKTIGAPPNSVLLFEKEKRGKLQLWARWTEEDGSRPEKLTKVRTIRDAKNRPLTSAVEAAEEEARGIIARLMGDAQEIEAPKIKRLTLAQGLSDAFGENGHWRMDDPTNWGRNVYRYLTDMIALLHQHNNRDADAAPLYFDEITPGMLKASMRTLALDGKANRGGQGLERASKMFRTFFALCKWLGGEYPDLRFPVELYQWKPSLREVWQEHTGRDLELEAEQSTVRHTAEEQVRLYATLDHRSVDPRLALMLQVGGATLRLGQVRETMRSRVDLSPGAGIGYGVIRPKGRKRKRTSPIYLTAEERARLDLALSDGYLRELEAAYRRGELSDYPLFCSGKLTHPSRWIPDLKLIRSDFTLPGYVKYVPGRRLTPIDKGTMLEAFHELERLAGITPVHGRGWYGLRRLTRDLYEEIARTMEGVDAGVRNVVQGWDVNSTVGDDIYRHKERQRALALGAELRTRVRALGQERTEEEAALAEPLEPFEDE